MWFKGRNQKSINIKDARDEILPCSQPELWPLCTRCSWQTFLLKIIIISSGVSFQETKEHSAEPFVTKARIGVPLMIKSCFLTVSSFFSTNLVPALRILLFDRTFCSNLYLMMLCCLAIFLIQNLNLTVNTAIVWSYICELDVPEI